MAPDCENEGDASNIFQQVPAPDPVMKHEKNNTLITWPSFAELRSELWSQACLGAPITMLNLLWMARFGVSTAFLGHLGGLELAGGTLALTYANVTGYALFLGLSAAMEPAISHALGAQRFDFVVSTLHKGILMSLLAGVLAGLSWLGVHRFLVCFGHSSSVAAVSKRYLHFLLPDLLLQAVSVPITVFLRCQLRFRLLLAVSGAGLVLHAAMCFFLVSGLGLGAAGTALAMCVSDLLVLFALLAGLLSDVRFRTSTDEPPANLRTVDFLFNLGLPSCAMICLEWWCYQLIVALAGLIAEDRSSSMMSASLLVLNSDPLFYAIQLALSSCACIRTSSELGANSPISAHHAALCSLLASIVLGLASFSWMVSGRSFWGKLLFSSNAKVVHEVGKLMPVMGLVELFSFLVLVSGGILRGSGKAMPGALASFGSLYVVGLPVSLVAGLVLGFGVLGLWTGLLGGVICYAAITSLAAVTIDWAQCEYPFDEDDECDEEEELRELCVDSEED